MHISEDIGREGGWCYCCARVAPHSTAQVVCLVSSRREGGRVSCRRYHHDRDRPIAFCFVLFSISFFLSVCLFGCLAVYLSVFFVSFCLLSSCLLSFCENALYIYYTMRSPCFRFCFVLMFCYILFCFVLFFFRVSKVPCFLSGRELVHTQTT